MKKSKKSDLFFFDHDIRGFNEFMQNKINKKALAKLKKTVKVKT